MVVFCFPGLLPTQKLGAGELLGARGLKRFIGEIMLVCWRVSSTFLTFIHSIECVCMHVCVCVCVCVSLCMRVLYISCTEFEYRDILVFNSLHRGKALASAVAAIRYSSD